MARILVVDDDASICKLLCEVFDTAGHQTQSVLTLQGATAKAGDEPYDLVFLDVQLPDGSGLDIIEELRGSEGEPEVIILTGYGNAQGAEIAIRNGAWDYLEKPPTLEQLQLALSRALDYRRHKRPASMPQLLDRAGIVGDGQALRSCLAQVVTAAHSNGSALITGETGAGKELVSRAVHQNSARRDKPFVVVDCTALPENLVESILFGHARGSFTGADRDKTGLLEKAHQGTLFLDEVGELPLEIQKKLLRAVQERCFRPVGSAREVSSDFRVVAATNRDLEAMAVSGEFRRDLLFRLKTFTISVPPLRERQGDIKTLALHFCDELCQRQGIDAKGYSPDFFEALLAYPWPGNVRELKSALEQVMAQAYEAPTLFAIHLPAGIRSTLAKERLTQPQAASQAAQAPAPDLDAFSLKEFRTQAADQAERAYLEHLLVRHGDDPTLAQRVSGLSKSRYYFLLQKHDL